MTARTTTRWELLRCSSPSCDHESVRPATGRRALLCHWCRSQMLVLELQAVDPEPQVGAGAFDVDNMAAALRAAAAQARQLAADRLVNATAQKFYAGRADAYSEAAEMAELIAGTASGVIPAINRGAAR